MKLRKYINQSLPQYIKDYMNLVKCDNKKVRFSLKMFSSFFKKTNSTSETINDKLQSFSISLITLDNNDNRPLNVIKTEKSLKRNI